MTDLQTIPDCNPILEEYRHPEDSQNYEDLSFSRDELAAAMRKNYDDLIAVVAQPAFQEFYFEMMALPQTDRPSFVASNLFDVSVRERRGINVPPGVLVQASAFGDRRPTLFVLKKLLPEKFGASWRNVNLTFDNEFEDSTVPRDQDSAWRDPLPVARQNAALARGEDLQAL